MREVRPIFVKDSKMAMPVESEKRSVSIQMGQEGKERKEDSDLLFGGLFGCWAQVCSALPSTLTSEDGETS